MTETLRGGVLPQSGNIESLKSGKKETKARERLKKEMSKHAAIVDRAKRAVVLFTGQNTKRNKTPWVTDPEPPIDGLPKGTEVRYKLVRRDKQTQDVADGDVVTVRIELTRKGEVDKFDLAYLGGDSEFSISGKHHMTARGPAVVLASPVNKASDAEQQPLLSSTGDFALVERAVYFTARQQRLDHMETAMALAD